MKNTRKLFFTFFAATLFILSCKTNVVKTLKQDTNKVLVTISLNGAGYNASRTALPEAIEFAEYKYTLTVSNISKPLFEQKSYDDLETVLISLEPGTYTFTLDVYLNSDVVLSGVQENIDISSQSAALSFYMYQVTGLNAAVEVVLELPTYTTIDAQPAEFVSYVKAGVADNPVATIDECNIISAQPLLIQNSGNKSFVTFTSNDLKTGDRQYIRFFLYDDKNNLIASVTEGVVLFYGKTSKSRITADMYTLGSYPVEIRLNKDGQPWSEARKVRLINKSDISIGYDLTKSVTGTAENPVVTFVGSVPNSAYYVAVQTNVSNTFRNTYVAVDTARANTQALEYYTVTLEPGTGVNIVSVTDVIPQPDGSILFLKGDSYTYKTELKNGYNTDSVVKVAENGTEVALEIDTERTISIDSKTTISTTEATAIEYTITYNISEITVGQSSVAPQWTVNKSNATVGANTPEGFKKYVVTYDFNLPTSADLICTGQLLDGWYKQGDTPDNAFAQIQADTLYENLTLIPKWKDASATIVAKPEVPEGGEEETESSEGTLSSNGISFIICDGGSSGGDVVTNIYYDINSNGEIDKDDGDVMVSVNGITNFTDYEITASALTGNENIASNVTFTVTGGRIYSIRGLGKDSKNISTLNIKGNPLIGGAVIKRETIDGRECIFATSMHGVHLNTFTKEKVNVIGKVTSAQGSVVLFTDYEYQDTVPHYVATMDNTTYAEAGLFACYNTTKTANGYARKNLGKVMVGGKYVVRLTNDTGIALKDNDESIVLIKDDSGAVVGFTPGADKINTACSVFSISCANGSMQFKQDKIYGAGDPKETGLSYLGQYLYTQSGVVKKAYAEELDTTKNYVYMHVMASNNQFTEGDASDFLENVVFIPDTEGGQFKTMSVKINLETIPYEVIKARVETSAITYINSSNAETTITGQRNKGFSYFDGSFYLGVATDNVINWIAAYNDAKKLRFNGLRGYLINITSDLENDYIFNKMELGLCWTGGARYDTVEDHKSVECLLNDTYHIEYDSLTRTEPGDKYKTDAVGYRWQSGPESGQVFTTGRLPKLTTEAYTGYDSGTRLTCSKASNSDTYFYVSKANSSFSGKDVYLFDVNNKYLGTATLSTRTTGNGNNIYYKLSSTSVSAKNVNFVCLQTDCAMKDYPATTTYDIGNGHFADATILGYANWFTGEPNDSNKGQSEECVHFMGDGTWNDYSWNYTGVQGYIVEFTPYDFVKNGKTYSSGRTDAAPITRTIVFNLNEDIYKN